MTPHEQEWSAPVHPDASIRWIVDSFLRACVRTWPIDWSYPPLELKRKTDRAHNESELHKLARELRESSLPAGRRSRERDRRGG